MREKFIWLIFLNSSSLFLSIFFWVVATFASARYENFGDITKKDSQPSPLARSARLALDHAPLWSLACDMWLARLVLQSTSQLPIYLPVSSSSSFLYIWRVGRRKNACYLVRYWKVRMRLPLCYFSTILIFFLGIEVEDVIEDVKRSYYSASLYVGDNKAAKSAKSKPRSSAIKWEWKANNQMWVVSLEWRLFNL